MPVVKKVRRLGGSAGAGPGRETSPLRPQFVPKTPPCSKGCPNGTDVREIIMTVALAEARGRTYDQAFEDAFYLLAEKNPLPATCGRVCFHHCEEACNRAHLDGAVAINHLERFIGDSALERALPLRPRGGERYADAIAVIGAGPAGLSCAYQLARRGYPVTVMEAGSQPGGMLRSGVSPSILPRSVLDAEIERLRPLGVVIRCDTVVGRDLSQEDIDRGFAAVFTDAREGAPGDPAHVAAGIGQGRRAADAIHHCLRGLDPQPVKHPPLMAHDRMRLDYYPRQPRAEMRMRPAEEQAPDVEWEVALGLTRDEAIAEAKRCMSCGACFACDNCWKYCQEQGVIRPVEWGQPYRFKLEFCVGCKKCAEECPCGYIEMW